LMSGFFRLVKSPVVSSIVLIKSQVRKDGERLSSAPLEPPAWSFAALACLFGS